MLLRYSFPSLKIQKGESRPTATLCCGLLLRLAAATKVRFRLPAPDYNSKIRLTLTLFGEGRLPASFSCLCDFPEN